LQSFVQSVVGVVNNNLTWDQEMSVEDMSVVGTTLTTAAGFLIKKRYIVKFELNKEKTMPATKKSNIEIGFGKPIVDPNMKSHANDPFVLKKVADAKEAISKIKLPEHLKK